MELAEDGPTGATLGCSAGEQSAGVPVWSLAQRAGVQGVALVWAGAWSQAPLGGPGLSKAEQCMRTCSKQAETPSQGQAGTPELLRIPQQGGGMVGVTSFGIVLCLCRIPASAAGASLLVQAHQQDVSSRGHYS